MSEIDEEKENNILTNAMKKKVPHRFFGVGARQWFCDKCTKKILTYDEHYHCFECQDYDLCNECYPKYKHTHPRQKGDINWFYRMLEPTWYFTHRLKEGQNISCTTVLMECFKYYSNRHFLGIRRSIQTKKITWLTYNDIFEEVVCFAKGLTKLGYKKGDFIGVLGKIQKEYIVIYFTCLYLGITFLPIQTILSREEKLYILNQTKTKALFFCTEYTKEVMTLKTQCKSIKDLFLFENISYINFIKKYDDIKRIGSNYKRKVHPKIIDENDICTIIYTSGTTGFPKGIVFRGKSFLSEMTRLNLSIPLVILSFLPYSHISGLSDIMLAFFNGGRACLLTNSDMKNVFDDFQLYNPTILSTIPRILNFVYNQYHQLIKVMSKEEVEKKLKGVFGTRVIEIVVGSAPCSMDVKQLIRDVCKIPVIDGYGISEVGTVSFNYGKMNGVDYKLLDCPELGYMKTNKPWPRGELIVRNDMTQQLEYYKNEKVTKERFDEDGFFHTGDIVELRGEKIVIIDRRNNILKMAQGEFVSVERIESILESSKNIDQFLIMPNPTKEKLVALGVALNKTVKKEDIMEDIVKIAKEYDLNPWEVPKNIHIVHEKFKLTELKKKNRKRIREQYKNELEILFKENEDTTIKSMLKKYLKGGLTTKVDGSKSFKELGGDSLAGTMLIKNMQMLGKNVKYEDLMKKSINDIMKTLDNNDVSSKGKIDDNEYVNFLEEEVKFKKFLEKIRKKNSKEISNMKEAEVKEFKNIFITGTSGFIGRYILVELLIQFPKSTLHVLVRKESKHKLQFKSNPRIHIIEGDLSLSLFGLSQDIFTQLSHNIDLILHGGAMVNHFLSYNDHYKANVKSIYNIIELSKGYKAIAYLSSLSVYAKYPPEKYIWNEKHKSKNGYAASKWMTDSLLTKHYQNCSIFRLTLIIGSRNTGEVNLKDWFNRIIHGITEFKMSPLENINTPLDMIPVDIIAYSIVKVLKKKYLGKQFTMSYKNCSFKEIFSYINQYLRKKNNEKLVQLQYDTWLNIMTKLCTEKEHPMLPFVGNMKYLRYDKFDTKLYEELVVKDDYRYPKGMLEKVKYKDIERYLDFIFKNSK